MVKIAGYPSISTGKIMHKRFFPRENFFNYKANYISFSLNHLNSLKKTFFSLNKFNFFGFYFADYGQKNQENPKAWLNKILTKHNINNIADIILVTQPRVFGYIFNPVSFWLCFNQNKDLIAVLSEVNNTCKQKHSYLCYNKDLAPIKDNEWLTADKEFYVSPFMKIEGEYKFKFTITEKKYNFFINYIVDKKLKLATSLKCELKPLTNNNIILSILKLPFTSVQTIFLIHYQALKLFLKKIQFYKCPDKLKINLTICKHEK
ncbi:MAG: DUF1365 domain-containing protein [Alphaproteobacteria bacterium]|jgi:uncharacterized protein|nr:DUF1365 domain-containing protein [Alphaproteobacteria bacterium]MBT5827325.1 DUF1365 domain-containing protein [Alphaproteobacteria bacterium]